MLRASVASYAQLDADFRWTPREELLLARTPAQLALARTKAAVIAAQGVRTAELDGDTLRAAFPAFGPAVLGGVMLEGVWTVDAELATRAFAEAAREAGARIRTQRPGGRGRGRRAADRRGPRGGRRGRARHRPVARRPRRVPREGGSRLAAAHRPARRAVDRRGGLLARPGRARPRRGSRCRWPRSARRSWASARCSARCRTGPRCSAPRSPPRCGTPSKAPTCRGAWRQRVLGSHRGCRRGVIRAWWGLRPMTPGRAPARSGPPGGSGTASIGPRRPRLARHAGRARDRRLARGRDARRADARHLRRPCPRSVRVTAIASDVMSCQT